MTSQYRCETCKFHNDIPGAIFAKVWCDKCNSGVIPNGFILVGCASHSDFQSEREKVLDLITKLRNSCYGEHPIGWHDGYTQACDDMREELREGKDGEQE
jgi:hypothetical protein